MLGDSAWLNYLWHVNRLPILHYQGDYPGFGTPMHPTRRISTTPAAYEFAGPIEATYPPWFDPAYWYEGLRPRFDPKGHLLTARWSLRLYDLEDALHHWMPSAVVLVLGSAVLVRRGWLSRHALGQFLPVWAPAVAALAMYASIHLESRYIAPFITLLWLGVTNGVRLPARKDLIRHAGGVLAVVLVFHVALVLIMTWRHAYAIGRGMIAQDVSPPSDVHWRVADGLRRMGVEPGDRVAVIGPGIRAYWARLARVRIVAEVPAWATRDFWTADAQVRRTILERFVEAGAKIVVNEAGTRPGARHVTVDFEAIGWQRIPNTDYYAFVLRQ